MKNISVSELNKSISNHEDLYILDIREKYEWDTDHLAKSHWIRMQEIPERINEIPKDIKVIVICRSGRRSEAVCHYLDVEKGFNNVWNLENGLLKWKEDIDSSFDIE